MPGGAGGDVLWPKRIEWFEQKATRWKKISFGPDFGGAIDAQGRLYVWGTSEQSFIGPLQVDVQGAGRRQGFQDVQFSAQKMFVLTTSGDALVFDDFLAVLQRRAAPLVEARKAQEALHSAPDEEKVQLESAAKEAELAAGKAAADTSLLKLNGTALWFQKECI
ncbi:Nipped-B-like protein B [Durusdinium trenchii]|uniref:Nipped-B-like protein B n=1 Tax=Durusdinium trenchii TaxID=1381693 RepID=A0ABP0HWL3_9DINO